MLEESVQQLFNEKERTAALFEEKEKLVQKFEKLKLRKGSVLSMKVCGNCRKDFKDSENFNWSCRVHQSQWSGEMWWCCGKSSKEAPGCKFGKHTVFVDEMDEPQSQTGHTD